MTIDLGKIQLLVKLTEPDLSLMEIMLHPGADSGLHRHTRERETFYVLEGVITFALQGQALVALKGESVSIPAHTLHRFQNSSSEIARAMLILNPGGLENYFIELRVLVEQQAQAEAFLQLNAKYGLEFER